jgi:hypothetical protein
MSIAISSLGVKVYYTVAADTAAPTSANDFIEIPEVKSIPSLSPAPDTLETTPLANTEYKTYINGLKDLGGALEFTVNLTQDLLDMWNGTGASDTASVIYKFEHLTSGNAMWLCIVHPKLTKAVYFPFEPAKLGLPEISVNSVLEGTLSITPIGEVEWNTKPTLSDGE